MSATVFTKPARVKVGAEHYVLGTMEQMFAVAGEMDARPSFAYLLGCAGCKDSKGDRAICTQECPCPCCRKRRGDKHVTTSAHVRVMGRAEFLARLAQAEAAVNA